MSKNLNNIFYGKGSLSNGLIALFVIGLIVLGCICKTDSWGLSNTNTEKKSTENKPKEDGNPFSNDGNDEPKEETYTKADASKKEVPSEAEMQEIVKGTMLGFNDAIQKGDFSDFHKTIARSWQRQMSPKKFEQAFSQFIDKKPNLSGIKSKKANFTVGPKIERDQRGNELAVEGNYSSGFRTVSFDLNYSSQGRDWKLSEIRVRVK